MSEYIVGRYKIAGLLGRGGMAEVFEAFDTNTEQTIALKMLLPHLAAEDVVRRRFLREARVGIELNHPGIVKVFDVGEAEDRPYMAMELVKGKTLEELLKTKCFDLEQCIGISLKITAALAVAHQKKIVHRDIKPRNIMLTDTGIKIMDFGLARVLETSSITDQHEIIGTLYYMSPEQAIGIKVDESSDVFSLGVVLYQMFTGQLPFAGEHPGAVIHAILYSDPLRINELGKALPLELEQVIFKALKKKPQARYRSASELHADLSKMHYILQGQPIQLLATEEVFEESPRGIYSQLIGRENEMAALETALDKMLQGESSVILVSGEAGIGKSRLVWELGRKAKEKQARYLLGRCLFGERGYPYQPVIDVLRNYFKIKGIKDPDTVDAFIAEKISHLSARKEIIHSLLLLQPGQPITLINKEQLWDTVSELIKIMAQDRPVVLHIDDLHWADTPTLNLLTYLAMTTRSDRLIIIGTYRPEELAAADGKHHPLEETRQLLSKENLFHDLRLARLSKQGTQDVVNSVFAGSDFPGNFYSSIHQETEGNPLFILEVLKYLQNEGIVDRGETGWHLAGELTKLAIPDRVTDVISQRLTKLTPENRALLDVAAVEGYTFQSDTLCHVLGEPRLRVLRRLQHLESQHRLVHALEHEYQFDHGKIQETIYNVLTPELKKEYHKRIAEYFITHYGDKDEYAGKIAKHLIEAEMDEKALPYLMNAGQYAHKLYAAEEALHYVQQGLDIVEEQLAKKASNRLQKMRLDLLRNRAETRLYLARYDETQDDYIAIEQCAQALNDKESKVDVLAKQGALCVVKAEYVKAMDYYNRALSMQDELNERSSEAKILHGIADVFLYTGKFENSLQYYQRALAIQDALNDRKGMANTLLSMSRLHFNKGEFDLMQEACEQGLRICEEYDYKEEMASIMHMLGSTYYSKGYNRKGIEITKKALLINRQIGNKPGECMCLRAQGMHHITAGEYDIASDCLREALEINKQIWIKSYFFIYNGMGEVASARGDFERALVLYQKARNSQNKVAEICYTGYTLNNIGLVQFYRGDYERALDYYEQAKIFHSKFGFTWVFGFSYAFSCLLWGLLGRRDKLLENLNRLRELNKTCRAIRADAWITIKEGYLNFLDQNYEMASELTQRGLKTIREVTLDAHMMSESLISLVRIEIARQNYTKALEYIKEALDYNTRLGRKQDVARTYLLNAQFDFLQEDYYQAQENAQQALEYAEKCGMKEIIWQAYHMLAKVYVKQRKTKDAKMEFNKANEVLDIIIHNLGDELKKIYLKRIEVKEFKKDLRNINRKSIRRRKQK